MLLTWVFITTWMCTRIDLFLLDGIREDFLLDGNIINNTYFPRLSASTLPSIKRTVLTETPTYTTNCLHAMYTCKVVHPLYVLLTLVPSIYAFVGGHGEPPHILNMLRQKGYSMSVSGDDTLAKLFPNYFNQSQTAYSFNIGDYDTVDNIVIQSLHDVWERKVAMTNQFSVYHYLGADHISHSEGIMSSTLRKKCNSYDALINNHLAFLHNAWTKDELDDYIVIILSDHGMTDKGTHGGFSTAEVRTPFLLFTSSNYLRENIDARMNQLILQRHVLLYVLSELFSIRSVSVIDRVSEEDIEIKTEHSLKLVSSIDTYIIIVYSILLLILATVVVIHQRPVSTIILTCQFVCAIADRFARNETVPLFISLIMESIWITEYNENTYTSREKYIRKSSIKRCGMHIILYYLLYGAWAVCLMYITRSIHSIIPIILILGSQLLHARAEIQYILFRLILTSMKHTELFSYKLPTLHFSTKLNNSANPWSCAIYVFLADCLPVIVTGNIYNFTNLAIIIFSSLLFRWHPLYNSICISKLVMEIMIGIVSLISVFVKYVHHSYCQKQLSTT